MTMWQRLFDAVRSSSHYGTSMGNPILSGGGPGGEREYLQRIRCPAGTPVTCERASSISTTDTAFLRRPGIRVELGPGLSARRSAAYVNPTEVALDVYDLACKCGRHRLRVFVDMYHRGPDVPLGATGWSLADGPRS